MRACWVLLALTTCIARTAEAASAFASACACRLADSSATCVPNGSCAGNACLSPNDGESGTCINWESLRTCPPGEYLVGAGLDCVTNAQGYKTACSTGTCVPCACPTGQYASLCGSFYADPSLSGNKSNIECSPCTGKPTANAEYTGLATPIQQNVCPWQCNTGFAGGNCDACITSCQPGYELVGTCTQTPGGAEDTAPVCVACNVSYAYSYSSGCTVEKCWPGYLLDTASNACVASPLPPFPPQPPSPPPAPPPNPPPLYATGAACAWDLAAHWVGISIPLNTSNATVLNDQKGRMPGVLMGGAAVTGGELALSAAGDYVQLPTTGYGTAKGFTLVVSFTPTSVSSGTQQVLAAFGTPTAAGGGLELGINGTFPYVANRGHVFTSATAVTAGTLSTISVVCASNRIYCFLI